MGKQTLSLLTCDGCGDLSLDGRDMHTLTMSAAGKMATVKRWDMCHECVAQLALWILNHDKGRTPTNVPL